MKIQTAVIAAITALTLTACETAPTTNANRASTNSNTATVVNSNSTGANANSMSPITTTNSSMASNSNRSSINYNGTAKDNETSRTSIESEAKQAGDSIGQGAEDWWIWSKAKYTLAAENDLRDSTINIDVNNSVITLRGNVRNKEQVAKADKAAKAVSGQKGVVNKLAVNANDTMLPNVTNSNKTTAPVKKS